MRRIWLAVLLCLAGPAWGAADETEVSRKLSGDATELLEHILGPGRGRVFVSVEGERTETRDQKELATPIEKITKLENLMLPGYVDEKLLTKKLESMVTSQEQTLRITGFNIKLMRVTAVIDKSIPDAQIDDIRRVLPELLQVKPDRGDEFSVVRATLLPAWKSLVLGAFGLRAASLFTSALFLALLLGIILYFTAMRVVKTFVAEMAAQRRETISAGRAAPTLPEQGASAMPELMPGGLPSLSEDNPLPMGAAPELGHRFDFLASHKAEELARWLEPESAQDVALLCAYLATSHPETASAVMAALPYPRQAAVAQALARLTVADPERLAMLESRMRTSAEYGLEGADRLGRILSRMPSEQRQAVMGDLMAESPQAAAEVQRSVFSFEDILQLKDQDMRRLIVAIPYEDWGAALRGAPQPLIDAVLGQIVAGPREMVRESIESPAPRHKVLEARSKIIAQAQALAARGLISFGRQDASSELI